MNFKKLFFVSAIALSSTLVFAQEPGSSFGRIYGGVAFMKEKEADSDTNADKGFQLGIARYIHLTGNQSALYLQLGAEFNRVTYSETVEGIKAKETLANIAIPINFVSRFNLENDMALEFLAGPNIRLNTVGKLKMSNSYDSATLDFFDDLEAKRFQFGLDVGVGLSFSRISIAYRFNPDLTDYFDKDALEDKLGEDLEGMSSKSLYHFITLGFSF